MVQRELRVLERSPEYRHDQRHAIGRHPEVTALPRKAIGDAECKGILQRNVARLADKPSIAQLDTERPAWTPEELRTFLDAAKDDELFALYRLAATCISAAYACRD